MKRLEWLSRELLIVGLIALGMQLVANATAAPPGTPQAQQLSVPDATRWMVFADTLTGRNYAAAIRGLREVGARQIVLHHWAWQADSPLSDALPQFIADGKANGISFCLHIDANLFGPAPHDKALDTFLDRAVALGIVDGAYIDGCEAFRGAGLTTPEANHFAYCQRVKDRLGLTGKRCYVEASSWQYCYPQVWALGTIDQKPEDQASLSRQVAACTAKIASCADAAQPWSRYGRSFGWLGPAIALDKPMASYPPEEYAEAWQAARRANAWVHMQVTLEWLGRPELAELRALIGGLESARAARPVWGAASAWTPTGSGNGSTPGQPSPPPTLPPPSGTVPAWANTLASQNALEAAGTIPAVAAVQPGQTVRLRGVYGRSAAIGGSIRLSYRGTRSQPIVVDISDAEFTAPLLLDGQGMILHADGGPKGVVRSWDTNPNPGIVIKGESICVRGVEVTGGPMRTTSAISVYGSAAKAASEIVILDCWVHDNGTPGPWTDATPDEDHHGIGIGAYSNVVRVVGCRLDRNSGDGIQINAGTLALLGTIDDVIVEGCSADDNKQAGFWCKAAQNVMFRGNTARNSRGSASNPDGAGMGCQYGPINVRFVGNTIDDCRTGFLVGSRSGPGGSGPGTGVAIEGNTIGTATTGLRVLGDNVVTWRGNALKDVTTETNVNSAARIER